MSTAGHQNVPAAWYPDQSDPRQLRWWDGHGWTGEVRPAIAIVPEAAPAAVSPTAAQTPSAAQLEARRSLHAAPQPAPGFGQATPEQLRTWPPPSARERNQLPTSVNELPRQWGMSTRDDATQTWFEQAQKPVQFVPRLADSGPPYLTEQTEFFGDADESVFGDTIESTIEMLTKTRPYSDLAGLLDEEFPDSDFPDSDFSDGDFPDSDFPDSEERGPVALPPVWRGVDEAPEDEHPAAPDPVGLTRRQLREMVGPLTTATDRD